MKSRKYSFLNNIKFVLQNVRRMNKLYLVIYFLRIPIEVFSSLVLIYFPKLVIDWVSTGYNASQLFENILIYVIILLSLSVIKSLFYNYINSMKYSFQMEFNKLKIEKMLYTDYYHLEDNKIMSSFEKAGYGTNCENIINSLSDLLIKLFGIITYGSILIKFSPIVLFAVIILQIPLHIFTKNMLKKKINNREKILDNSRKINYLALISFMYNYGKDIRLFNMSPWLSKKTDEIVEYDINLSDKNNSFDFKVSLFTVFIFLIKNSISYGVLLYLLINKSIEISEFVLYVSLVSGLSEWVSSISANFNTIYENSINVTYLRQFIDISETFNRKTTNYKINKNSVSIEFKNACFTYDGEEFIENLNLYIKAHEKIAIVGPNGSGKTTLVKLLCGMYKLNSGEILINDVNINDINIFEYYELFSTVFQDSDIVGISIEDFISSVDDSKVNIEKLNYAIEQAGLKEKIEHLEEKEKTILGKGLYEKSTVFSGGELQKLLLARAIYKDAPVLVLDEPTAALDPIAEFEFYKSYMDVYKEKTSIFITHRLASTKFCDKICYIENGKIVESGTHDDLISLKGKYYEMFMAQSKFYQSK